MKYIIIQDNSYDAQDVLYCDSQKDLIHLLKAKGYNGYDWPVDYLEVYAVSNALTIDELTTLRDKEVNQ